KLLAFFFRQGYSVSWCHGESLPLEFAMIIPYYTKKTMLRGTSAAFHGGVFRITQKCLMCEPPSPRFLFIIYQ
ncbi:MAG: hypothetical protein ACLP3B_21270, partial [Syntrophobacteraceae bacterium]